MDHIQGQPIESALMLVYSAPSCCAYHFTSPTVLITSFRLAPAAVLLLVGSLGMASPGATQTQARRPLTALDLYHLRVASDPVLSPDGRRVVYVVTETDSAANRYRRDLWTASADGSGAPRRLTWAASASLGTPSFFLDGRHLAFTSARGWTSAHLDPSARGRG